MKIMFYAALALAAGCLAAGIVCFIKIKEKSRRLTIAAISLCATALWLAFALCLGFFTA